MGLSEAVERAVPDAVRVVRELLDEQLHGRRGTAAKPAIPGKET